ncbi:TraB/GumN family protein [Rhizobium sp. FY34]|uniref:TraB/GumN family protein n=1 Tax=Rhizobium sp. FY34 TaxID=2562309 RepID=UPI0010C10B18|nr:TraB/GumN family protein [Rhizobium sp. FY34]
MNTHPAFDIFRSPRRPSDIALWLIAALHAAAFLSFLLVMGFAQPARAQGQDMACRGTNVLTQLKAQNPAAYARVEAEAAKVENGKGLFWKIDKPGLAPSYLLGTMHVTDPRVLAMPNGAVEAKSSAKVIVVESDEILNEQQAMAKMLAKPALTMMTDGKTIQSYLSAGDLAKLEAGLKTRGIPLAAVSRMQPWMLSSFIALPACELTRKAQGASFLDKQIAEDAVRADKPVKGLETMEEQLSAMASIPTDFHIKSLMEMITLGDRMDDVMFTMTELYLSGDVGMTMPMLKAVSPDGADGEGYAEFEERIVTKRNHRMAERAAPILKDGGAFVAVGALHLVGPDGLVSLLRQQGFAVTRVE